MGKHAAARFYRAFEASRVERDLLLCMEEMARKIVKAKFGTGVDLFFNEGAVNVALLNVVKGFNRHHDADNFNTRLADNEHEIDYKGGKNKSTFLPTREMMVVVTLVFSGPLATLKKDENNYQLDWYPPDSTKSLCTVQTLDCDAHIQIACQGGSVHDGKQLKVVLRNNSHRFTISLRGYCNPTVNYRAWQRRCELVRNNPLQLTLDNKLIGDDDRDVVYRVLDMLENPHKSRRSAVAGANEETIRTYIARKSTPRASGPALPPSELLTSQDNNDVYPNCPKDKIPVTARHRLHEGTLLLQFKQPLVDLYMSWGFQRILFANKILLRVLVYKHGRPDMKGVPLVVQPVPTFSTGSGALIIPDPDHYYPSGATQEIGNLRWSNRSKPIICTDNENAATLVCLHTKYRIDATSARACIMGRGTLLHFYGSGGAGYVIDQLGPDIVKGFGSEFEPAAFVAHSQVSDPNKTNNCLVRAAENNRVMSLWMGRDLIKELAPDRFAPMSNDELYFVGFFYCDGVDTVSGVEPEKLMEEFAEIENLRDIHSHPHLSFRTCSHKKFRFKMIEPHTYLKGLLGSQGDGAKDWKLLTITDRDEPADFRLPVLETKLSSEMSAASEEKITIGNWTTQSMVARHMTLHFNQHVKKLIEHLPKLHEVGIITENEASARPDSRVWNQSRDSLIRNPFVTHNIARKVSISEAVTLAVGMAFSVFCRMDKKSLTESGEIIPLSQVELGSLLRMLEFPHPIRSFDLPPLLYYLLSSAPLGTKTLERDLSEDLVAALVCHVYGRPCGFGHFFKSMKESRSCLRIERVGDLCKHMQKSTSDSRVRLTRYTVKQYEKQIPPPLRTSVDTATVFLNELSSNATEIAGGALKFEVNKTRREYVIGLSSALASLAPGMSPPEFYFVAQHIVATLAESYPPKRFGEVTMDDVHMGPGSRAAIRVLALSRSGGKKKKDEADDFDAMSCYLTEDNAEAFIHAIHNLSDLELAVMGLYKQDGHVLVRLTGRPISYLDLEHLLCKIYLYFKKKGPAAMRIPKPQLDVCHCHPARYNCDALDPRNVKASDISMRTILDDAFTSFPRINFKMPWKMLFHEDWDALGLDFKQIAQNERGEPKDGDDDSVASDEDFEGFERVFEHADINTSKFWRVLGLGSHAYWYDEVDEAALVTDDDATHDPGTNADDATQDTETVQQDDAQTRVEGETTFAQI